MLAITALGLVVAISVLVSQMVPEPFGGRSLTPPTVLPTSISEEKGSADSNLTGTNPNTQLVPQETTETLEQSSVNEELSEVTQLSSVNFTSFRNSTYGLQMQYPSQWEIEDVDTDNDGTVDIAGFISPIEDRFDRYKERLWLSLDTLPQQNMTIEQYSRQVINNSRESLQDFQLLDNNTDSNVLAGRPAYDFVHIWTLDDDRTIKQMEIGTKVGDKVYYLDYYAEEEKYADYLPIIQEMINSLEIGR